MFESAGSLRKKLWEVDDGVTAWNFRLFLCCYLMLLIEVVKTVEQGL